jgi:diguanylate cyclase (GGDEF)-like protein
MGEHFSRQLAESERGRVEAQALLQEKTRQIETALAYMSQGLLMFGADTRLVTGNRRYIDLYGLSADVVKPGCPLRELIEHRKETGTFRGDVEQYCREIIGAARRGEPQSWDFTLPDGRRIHAVNRPMAGGGWVSTHEEVTESFAAERRMREQKLLLDTALQNMSQGLCMFGPDGVVRLFNDRFVQLTQHSPEALERCSLLDLFRARKKAGDFEDDPEEFFARIKAEVMEGRTTERIRKVRGGRILRFVDQPMADGGWVATVEDISGQIEAQRRIAHLAYNDSLTDLPNRAAFNEFLSNALKDAAKTGGGLSIACMDIDDFKEVNDVFGHAAGDELLKQLGKRLQEVARGSLVARVGGDSFQVVIASSPQPLMVLMAQLHSVTKLPFVIDGNPIRIGLTMGAATYPADGADLASLLGNAEAALYRAKRKARGSIQLFEPATDHQLRERHALQHDLRAAMELGHLGLAYQPQARIDGTIVGFEALMRWQHPARGAISPATFIPLAEETGLIMSMGEWALRKACAEAASWARPLRIAVNLSPLQLRHSDLPALVHAVLLDTGLAASRLELEITESVLLEDTPRALSVLRRLKTLGARIVMDDFGTGYSSLSYLHAFPFDKIKIDRIFVSKLDAQSVTIVHAIISLARSLKLPVIAEGVEDERQLAVLRSEGCDEIQGYLIGKPGPIFAYAQVVGSTLAESSTERQKRRRLAASSSRTMRNH